MRMEFLDGAAAIRALEPDISGDYQLGLFIPEQGSSVNPLRQAQVVARGVERLGGTIRQEAVRALATEAGRVTGVDDRRRPAARPIRWCWRPARGRRGCWRRSASGCRWRPSAATT